MKRKLLSLLGILAISFNMMLAQIANPDFESYSSCPTTYGQANLCNNWTQSTAGTSDYYNSASPCNFWCNAFIPGVSIPAKQGGGYMGTYLEYGTRDYKEYITNDMTTNLKAGVTYNISFWTTHLYSVSSTPAMTELPSSEMGYLGICFSRRAYTNTASSTSIENSWYPAGRVYIPASNTTVYGSASRNTWVKVNMTYTADGTESYMTIGQFRPGTTTLASSSAVYYLFDGFSMTPATSLSKSVSPAAISDGGTATYTFTIDNTQSGSVSQTGIGFTDTLPSGLKIAATPNVVVSGLTAGTTTATAGGSSIAVSGYSIAAGATGTITVDVTNVTDQVNASCGSNPAAFTNGASNISGLSSNLGNNVGNVCLVVSACKVLYTSPVVN